MLHQILNKPIKAIRNIHRGEYRIDRSLSRLALQAALPVPLENRPGFENKLKQLPKRESSIACLAAKAYSAHAIGEQLSISDKTVRNILTAVYEKLEVKSKIDHFAKAPDFGFYRKTEPRIRELCPNYQGQKPQI